MTEATHPAPPGVSRAESPGEFRAHNWRRVAARVFEAAGRRNLSLIAAGVAFYGLLSLAPALAALAALYGLFADPAAIRGHLEILRDVAPPAAFDAVLSQAQALEQARPTALGWASGVAILLAVWTARAGVGALMTGIGVAYRQPSSRSFLWDLVVTYGLTFGLILAAAVILSAMVLAPAALAILPFGGWGETVTHAIRWPAALIAIMAALAVLYRYAPSRTTARLEWVTPGAVAATALWLAGSIAFSAYASRFADYNATYGTLGAVALLMTWFWLSAYAAMLGAALNAELEYETAADTTVEPEKPMGERGAVVADTVAAP